MDYELIPDHAYDALPSEPEEKLAYLAKIAQANLNRLMSEDTSARFDEEVRNQFVETMRAVADALRIEGLPSKDDTAKMSSYDEYRYFSMHLSALITKVNLQNDLVPRPYSVRLGRITKAKIRQECEQLRFYIENSNLTDKKKAVLDKNVSTLLIELDRDRLSFGQVAAITAAIATTFGGTATAVAKAPEAYNSITVILAAIGEDKEKEEAERERLTPPPKALPAPPIQQKSRVSFDDLDDDVPF